MTHNINKTYTTEKGVPVKLHENRMFTVFFNGYYHYLEGNTYARGVVMVPWFSNGDLLLVRLRRAPAIGFSVEFPRGGVSPEETLIGAAARELSEETGFTVSEECVHFLGKLGPDTATLNGLSDVFSVQIPDSSLQGNYDTEEIDKPFRVSQKTWIQMICDGTIVDGQSLAAWAMFSARNPVKIE
jgi:8-oxo-dGTP pyrophosphatase MutT (NUDIX family)